MRPILMTMLLFCFGTMYAQQQKRADDVFFKKYLVRSMDLHESANEEIFGSENYLVKALLRAYCSGDLKGYTDQKLTKALTGENFEKRLQLLGSEAEWHEAAASLHQLEIGEYLIFNKHTSDFYFSMESLTIYIPASLNSRGLQEPLISFSYVDCSRIFKGDSLAVSYNPLKNGRDINYTEVFLLRMFNSTIVKIGNSRDLYFDQAASSQMSAFLNAKASENKLSEYIYKLYNPE